MVRKDGIQDPLMQWGDLAINRTMSQTVTDRSSSQSFSSFARIILLDKLAMFAESNQRSIVERIGYLEQA